MTNAWTPKDTTTHQDQIIAHVLGTTILGYFVFDEVLYIVLDIGFIWSIFLDGGMGLLPHPVAMSELEVEGQTKEQLKADIDVLLSNSADKRLLRFTLPPVPCQIKGVGFFADGEQRRLLISGETGNVAIETSLTTAGIRVHAA
ncbi:MAG: hypothetical protein ACREA9_15665 [Pyrinomonadaceae bacterium]